MNKVEQHIKNCGETFANCKVIMRRIIGCDDSNHKEEALGFYYRSRNDLALRLLKSIDEVRNG